MDNPVLEALTILHSWAENTATNLDDALMNADDGEKHSVKEAQEDFDREVSNMISELEQLRVECKVKSWKEFKSKNL